MTRSVLFLDATAPLRPRARPNNKRDKKMRPHSLYLRVLMGSNPDTAETATTMAVRTTPPAMTEFSRFLREGVTAA